MKNEYRDINDKVISADSSTLVIAEISANHLMDYEQDC